MKLLWSMTMGDRMTPLSIERRIMAQFFLRLAVALSLVTLFLLKSQSPLFLEQSISTDTDTADNIIFQSRFHGITGNTVLSYRPASIILQNTILPEWVKNYVAWHREHRARFLDAKRNNSPSADDVKFLIVRCSMQDRCGGASDRLQDLPYKMMIANQTNRVLLVVWEKPVPLEIFLVPPADGIDWSMQGEMYDLLKDLEWNMGGDEHNANLQIVSTIRMPRRGVPLFREYETNEVGHNIYHELFRLLFEPSPELAERVEATMKSLDLAPSQYSSVHLRVEYPRHGIVEESFSFHDHKAKVVEWARNAVNCAVELHPNSTIYVSSDNNDTVGYLLEDSPFAQHYIDAIIHNKHPVVKLVARDYSKENAHIAFSPDADIDEFMSTFEDLMIIGMSKCVAHGLGGYGRLGAALSGGECVVIHRGENSKVCSDALASP